MRNFKPYYGQDDEPSFEMQVSTRVITGRLTKQRYKLLQRYCRKKTERAPYGYSPNGYRYHCGHEYDCCGCLMAEYMTMKIEPHWKGNKITFYFTQSFNY